MRLLKLAAIGCLLYINMPAQAQQVSLSKLIWSSVATTMPSTGETIEEATQLVTDANQSIQWTAADGSAKYNLAIIKINGSWADVMQVGSIIYEVDNNGKRGVITIERSAINADLVKVRIMITTDAEPSVYELTINSVKTF